MSDLIPFLRDVVKSVMPFSSLIDHIHVKEVDGHLLTMASANDGSVHLKTTSVNEISLNRSMMCLGNLPYLNQILTSDFLKDNKANVLINSRERNEKSYVSSLQFIPNNRMETTYTTTDPFRASMNKPKRIITDDWPVTFIIDEQSYREIAELKKIHAAAPSVGSDDILRVGFAEGDITIDFGEGGGIHTSTLRLTAEVMSDTTAPIGVHLLADQFLRGLMQSLDSDRMIELTLSDKAIQMVKTNPIAQHELVLVRRKLRDD